eukprot:scaffold1036_cov169-Ochromonas_danica.AAC.23
MLSPKKVAVGSSPSGSGSGSGSGSSLPFASQPVDFDTEEPNPIRINQMYSAVLDHLLTPPQVKEGLMSSQSKEKKWQTVKMYRKLFEEHSGSSSTSWGDRENALLTSIARSKMPDVAHLSRLKIVLSSANRELMTSFLDAGGISVLLRAIEGRLNCRPQREVDIAILYEILSCCKVIMNNDLGMEAFAATPGAIDIVARCLKFEYKLFALLVLEILSVCCYYSDKTASIVWQGMRMHARFHQEAPFSSLLQTLLHEDIEYKASIMQFINSLIMGQSDTTARFLLRSEFKSQLLDEKVDESCRKVEKELSVLPQLESSEEQSDPNLSKALKLRGRTLTIIHGTKALDERKVEAMIKNINNNNVPLHDELPEPGISVQGQSFEVKSKTLSITVNPLAGTMAGLFHVAKNADKLESKFLDMVGGKKTKRRWFELDGHAIKWCAGHDKEVEYKGTIPISSVLEIRNYTTDPAISSSCQHCLEIDTTDRVYALASETLEEKEKWITALQKARDDYIIAKGSYKLQTRELSPADVGKFVEMFRKQVAVYQSIATEDRRLQLDVAGLDLSNANEVLRYLLLEATSNGNISRLLSILYELLLLPPGAQGCWETVQLSLQKFRESAVRDTDEGVKIMTTPTILDLFVKKTQESGAGYGQVSKLALTLLAHERETENLQDTIRQLEKKVTELSKEVEQKSSRDEVETTPTSAQARLDSQPSQTVQRSRHTVAQSRRRVSLLHRSKEMTRNDAGQSALTAQSPEKRDDVGASETSRVLSTVDEGDIDIEVQAIPSDDVRQKKADKDEEAPVPAAPAIPSFSVTSIPTAALPSAPAPAAVVDERYAKYAKMKTMLPEGAVRQKMMVDGFSEVEIEAFFSGAPLGAASTPAVPSAPAPAAVVDERYAKYAKMKIMLPEGAVRQKMMVDGFSEVEIGAFFSGAPLGAASTPAVPSAPAAVVDERYAKYAKMKTMLPEGAVRQKMMVDGFSGVEIEAFFSGTPAVPSAPAPAAVVDERYAKYAKMKTMLPEGAVRQKMVVDGFSEVEIEAFFSGTPAVPSAPAPAAVVDERYAKYAKMKTMLPEGAVRQKMVVDGFSEAEIDRFFGSGGSAQASRAPVPPPKPPAPALDLPPEGMTPKPKIKPATKLKGLFWTKLKPDQVKATLWYNLPDFSLPSRDAALLEEWFSSKGPGETSTSKKVESKGEENAVKLVSVLDGKRTQSVLILLGKLRINPEDLAQRIQDLDSEYLDQELTSAILEVVPTPEESTAVKSFSNPAALDRASRLAFHLSALPRLAQRLECHLLGFTWPINATITTAQVQAIALAVTELKADQRKIEKIFSMVLGIGNYINGDTARGQAYGVKIDIFSKVTNLKAQLPSQGTLMNFIALIVEQQAPDIRDISEKWTGVWAAGDISFKQLITDINQLEVQLNKVEQELVKAREMSLGAPLIKRLEQISQANRPKFDSLKKMSKSAESELEHLMARYGEDLRAVSDEDPCKKFFVTIADFAKALRCALEENSARRAEAEKSQQKSAAPTTSIETESSGKINEEGSVKKKAPQENIFGRFHDAQKASAGDVLAEFKMRMAKGKK